MSDTKEYNQQGDRKAKLKLAFYSDPGHGWLSVKRKLLHQLGINNLISAWSYEKGHSVYLEEDYDVGVLLEALDKKKMAYSVTRNYRDRSSYIRNYTVYKNVEDYFTAWD